MSSEETVETVAPDGAALEPDATGAAEVGDDTFDTVEAVEGPATCSAKGCQAQAQWELLWNNPKLHTTDRRKTWLACEEHKTSLSEFLSARRFLREVVPHPS